MADEHANCQNPFKNAIENKNNELGTVIKNRRKKTHHHYSFQVGHKCIRFIKFKVEL